MNIARPLSSEPWSFNCCQVYSLERSRRRHLITHFNWYQEPGTSSTEGEWLGKGRDLSACKANPCSWCSACAGRSSIPCISGASRERSDRNILDRGGPMVSNRLSP